MILFTTLLFPGLLLELVNEDLNYLETSNKAHLDSSKLEGCFQVSFPSRKKASINYFFTSGFFSTLAN